MTIDRVIIFWLMILFFVASSTHSVLDGDGKVLCFKNSSVNQSRKIPYKVPCEHTILWWKESKCMRLNITYETVWIPKQICCEDYVKKNGTCKPQCSSNCPNGYCHLPNICACNYGWVGDVCDESLFCFVRVNFTEEMRTPSAMDVTDRNVIENPHIERMRPACHSKCRDKLNTTDAHNMTQYGNSTYYLFPIDSPCNAEFFREKYTGWIGAVAVILSFAILVFAIYIARKKWNTRNEMNKSKLTKMIDLPTKVVSADYMEENQIYS